jgi:hypothetical protein
MATSPINRHLLDQLRRHIRVSRAGLGIAIGLPLSISVAAVVHAPLPEPVLRITSTLKAPAERQPISDTERALLRLEARNGQSRIDEKALIDDMMARLERMSRTLAELQPLIAAMSNGPCPKVAPRPCPDQSQPSASPPDGFVADLPWLLMAGSVVLLALLGMLWQSRRRKASEFGADDTLPWHSESETAPPSLTKPPVSATPTNREAKETAVQGDTGHAPASRPAPAAEPTQEPIPSIAAPENSNVAITDADLSLELAEVMLSMRLTDSAAQTLEEHIRLHPRQALVHWLKLLDIYRRSGQQTEFEEAAIQLQRQFNIAPPDWRADPDPVAATRLPGLENYIHICGRIQELWPRRSCAEYLGRLLEDNRGGTRTGFPKPVIEDILLLLAMLRA